MFTTASCWAAIIQAPWGISISPFLVLNSGTPFNITVGQDLNGDNQFNDRPSFATSSSTDVMNTKYGRLRPGSLRPMRPASPTTSSPARGSSAPNLRVSKSIGIGPRIGASGRRRIQWAASGRRRSRAWRRWPSRRRTGPRRPQQFWRKASDARSAGIQALFAELHGHGQKYLQQREPCAAGGCSWNRRYLASRMRWREASFPRLRPTAASTCRCRLIFEPYARLGEEFRVLEELPVGGCQEWHPHKLTRFGRLTVNGISTNIVCR